MASGDLSAGERRRARTRAALLAAARELFSERGYHQTRVDEVTARAGLATGTFYLYFKDKPAIALALLETVFEVAQAAMEQFAELGPAIADPRAVTRTAIRQALEAYESNAALMRLLEEQAPAATPELAEARRAFYMGLSRLLAGVVQELGAPHGVTRERPDLVAEAVIGAVQRMAYGALILGGESVTDSLVDAATGVIARLLGWEPDQAESVGDS